MEHGGPGLILTLGGLLLLALAIEGLARRARVPQVTLLVLAGILIGKPGLDLLPAAADAWYPVVSDFALLIVGFLLGRHLSLALLRAHGRRLVWFSLSVVLGTSLTVGALLVASGFPVPMAMVLAGIAPASAPTAILNVVEENEAAGSYTETMLAVVAINNALVLITFDLLLAGAETLIAGEAMTGPLLAGGHGLVGAVLVGAVTGLPAGRLIHRVRSGESMQLATLGLVLACGGLALWIGASYLLAAIALGAVLVNSARGDARPFETVQALDWPILALFFILTGAGSHPETLLSIGWLGGVYVIARALGLIVGAWTGGFLGRAPQIQRRWLGPAIMPQAGVALGMALVASEELPRWGETVLAVVVGSTVLFELVGPVLTRLGLSRAGNIRSPAGF
jgi:Kef-type K+ transport system membrane component KefB